MALYDSATACICLTMLISYDFYPNFVGIALINETDLLKLGRSYVVGLLTGLSYEDALNWFF